MKQGNMIEVVISDIVKLATESQDHQKYLDKLKLLSESESYEELVALALIEKEKLYVKTVCSVSQLIHRHSFCQFLGNVFMHATQNPERFLRLQAAIMRIILSWDCNLRDSSSSIEESVKCDAECLTFLLPIVGPKLEENFSSQLNILFHNIRCSTLAEFLPRMLRSMLLDLLLLRASGWKSKVDSLNFGTSVVNGNLPDSPAKENEDTCTSLQPVPHPVSQNGKNNMPQLPKEEETLLRPSQFHHPEEILENEPPKSIDYSNLNPIPSGHLPVYVGVESPTTLQKNAPKANMHPKPPPSWLTSENPIQEFACTYVPFRPSISPTENADFIGVGLPVVSNFPTRRNPTVASHFREELPNHNGARPRIKANFHTEDISEEKEVHLPSDNLPTSAGVPRSSPIKLEPEFFPSSSSESTRPVYKGGSGSAKDESFGYQKSKPKLSLIAIEKVNEHLRPDFVGDAEIENGHSKESTKIHVVSFSDDDDIIVVEEPSKKTTGTKKKTKWTPLSTATTVKGLSFKEQSKKPVEVVRSVIKPTEHPFFSSQRICGVCGDTDHMTQACTKSIQISFPKDF